jgi:hypothetical protein
LRFLELEPTRLAARTTPSARGCSERLSTEAARASTSLWPTPLSPTTSVTSGLPTVSVPSRRSKDVDLGERLAVTLLYAFNGRRGL